MAQAQVARVVGLVVVVVQVQVAVEAEGSCVCQPPPPLRLSPGLLQQGLQHPRTMIWRWRRHRVRAAFDESNFLVPWRLFGLAGSWRALQQRWHQDLTNSRDCMRPAIAGGDIRAAGVSHAGLAWMHGICKLLEGQGTEWLVRRCIQLALPCCPRSSFDSAPQPSRKHAQQDQAIIYRGKTSAQRGESRWASLG